MLKIRYNLTSGLLSGWTDNETEFSRLRAIKGERTAILDFPMPDADDYEYFCYSDGQLLPSGKLKPIPEPPRDLLAEIDELKARLDKITKVKGVA